jgi:outer membrane protein
MKKIILLILLIGNLTQSKAQNIWNLQKCIQYAIENNLQLKQSVVNVQTAKINANQVKMSYLPSLSADATQYYSFGRVLNPTSNSYESSTSVGSNTFSVNSSLPIFAGLTKYSQLIQTKFDLQASHSEVEKTRNDIALNIAAYYLSVLNAKEQLKIMQQQKKITLIQKINTDKLIAAGSIAEISIKDVEATLANDELNIVSAQNNFDVGILHLKQLLNMDVNQYLMIDTTLPNLHNTDADLDFNRTYSLAFNLQPSIKYNYLKLQSAQQNIKYYQGAMAPTLSLFGSLRTSYSDAAKKIIGIDAQGNFMTEKINFNDQISKNYGKSIGLDLSIPIYNAYQTRSALQRSKLQVITAKLNLEIAEKQLQQDIAQAILNVKAAAAKQEAAKALVIAQQSAFDANTKKYEAGVINYLDFNTSKNNLTKSLSESTNAQFDYLFKIKILDFYQGKPMY